MLRGSQAPRRAVCGTRGSLRTMHGGGSAPSCCAFPSGLPSKRGPPCIGSMGSLTFLNDWKKNRRIAFCDMGKCSFSVHHVCWSHAHSHHLCVAHGRFHVAGADADLLRWPGGGLHFCRHWSEILNLVNEGVPYFYLALSSEPELTSGPSVRQNTGLRESQRAVGDNRGQEGKMERMQP